MAQATTEGIEFTTEAARDSFQRHLRAANKSPRTIDSYLEAVTLFDRFLAEQGMPRDVTAIRREHVESWIIGMQDSGRYRPASIANRYRSLRVFFNWLVSEDEIPRSPMAKMRAPFMPEIEVPLLTDAQVAGLLATCDGTSFDERRDTAILRLLIDCGMRRAELGDLRLEDVDFPRSQLWIREGKGRRSRPVPMHDRAVKSLDRYLRLRPRHPHHKEEALFLGKRGPLGDGGILQVIRRRGTQAGIPSLHPHQLRHLAAHNAAAEGMTVPDMMKIFGWRDSSMALRYGSSAGTERALAHAKALRGGDRY
jgi:site-specific recombinase XerD